MLNTYRCILFARLKTKEVFLVQTMSRIRISVSKQSGLSCCAISAETPFPYAGVGPSNFTQSFWKRTLSNDSFLPKNITELVLNSQLGSKYHYRHRLQILNHPFSLSLAHGNVWIGIATILVHVEQWMNKIALWLNLLTRQWSLHCLTLIFWLYNYQLVFDWRSVNKAIFDQRWFFKSNWQVTEPWP